MKRLMLAVLVVLAALAATGPTLAQGGGNEPVITRDAPPDPALVTYTQVAGGFDRPLFVTHAGDGSGRLFVVEQTGRIWILEDGARRETPFLDLSASVTPISGYSEQGLLGLAFHPAHAGNGRLFVSYTDHQGTSIVAEYAVAGNDPNVANPASARELLRVDQPYPNHNGGMIAFGPDGYLYISLGDGGSAGDPQGNAQNPWTLLGSILRVDVVGDERPYGIPADNPFALSGLGAPEIWAWGLRNVWRFSFDRATGALWIGDVGQDTFEEVDRLPPRRDGRGAGRGANLGWSRMEGDQPFAGGTEPANHTGPLFTYPHGLNNQNGCAVIGGYVYRGAALPGLQGTYVYGDLCRAELRGLRQRRGQVTAEGALGVGLGGAALVGFAEDAAGELYTLGDDGVVSRIEPAG